jgi:hypothetical protein
MVTYDQLTKATKIKMKKEKVTTDILVKLLNTFLPDSEKIPTTRSGQVQVSRWLNPNSEYHCIPRAGIALAMVQWTYGLVLLPPDEI